jgi:hypothetical protein
MKMSKNENKTVKRTYQIQISQNQKNFCFGDKSTQKQASQKYDPFWGTKSKERNLWDKLKTGHFKSID